nr:enolase C-terminal domain-like protein [Sporosarcina sp. P33]
MKINALAEANGVECMMGSMMETAVGVTAAAHAAASQPNITRVDLDAPLLLKQEFDAGGVRYNRAQLEFDSAHGLGFDRKRMMQWVKKHAYE